MANKEAIERVKRLNNLSSTISTDPIDHDKLFNREEANQHPISAITNLEAVISELKGANEYIGEIESVEDGKEQTALTIFVIEQKNRTPRLNDIIRIKSKAEMWRHNGDSWEHYLGTTGDIPLASKETVGGVKIDHEKFTLDEEGYLSYNIANDEAHQNLTNRIDELSKDIDSKVGTSEISEVVNQVITTSGIDDGEI